DVRSKPTSVADTGDFNNLADSRPRVFVVHKYTAGRILHEKQSSPGWLGQGDDTRYRNVDALGRPLGGQRQYLGGVGENFIRSRKGSPGNRKRAPDNEYSNLYRSKHNTDHLCQRSSFVLRQAFLQSSFSSWRSSARQREHWFRLTVFF